MKILFNIAHPAQVHLFRNAIRILSEKGHDIKVTAVDKEVSAYLLKAYNIEHEIVGKARSSILGKAIEMLKIEKQLYSLSKKFRPDVLVGGVGNAYVAHVGKLIGRPSIVFDDTEHAKIEHFLMDPFVTTIVTPSCYKKNLGKKQVRYNGYHELAYLHPNYFKPDPSILDKLGLSKGDTFILLRFVSWTASHDVGQKGIQNRINFVKELEKYGQVLISAEGRLEKELEKYRVRIPPDKIHDVLYYATLYVGEGATMATESAILGTPAVYISSLVGTMGNFIELEKKYGLVFNYTTEPGTLKKAIEILEDYDQRRWRERRKRLIREKIDVTKFMVWFIKNYPRSINEIKENPMIQYRFR
ncbi:MAG: DUF354 domain-containing protein [Thermosipho sp. (in: Bacteria)]|nr:DUF354 domain-containing protein [Thermosipho sp. (in: thermotogales)]